MSIFQIINEHFSGAFSEGPPLALRDPEYRLGRSPDAGPDPDTLLGPVVLEVLVPVPVPIPIPVLVPVRSTNYFRFQLGHTHIGNPCATSVLVRL